MSFFHRILGEKSGFCLGGEVTFQSVLGERVLERNLNFLISAWGESDFWQFTLCLGISDVKNQNFSNHDGKTPKFQSYLRSFSIIRCSQMEFLLKMPPEKLFWGEIENFGLCLSEGTDPGWHYVTYRLIDCFRCNFIENIDFIC